MKMTIIKKLLAGAGGSAAVALLSASMLIAPQADAQIKSTKHNLGSSQATATSNQFDGTGEVCVFCHTPHGSDTSAAVPLWNRAMSSPTIYTTYNSLGTSSLDGSTAPVGSVSLACLSCHDGTQAMNVMINQPGSGNYNSAGAAMAGAWTGDNQTDGKLKAGIITNIDKDLRNDHPIGIQYAGGPKSGTPPAAGTAYGSALFRDADFRAAASTSLNGMAVWWVDTPDVGTAGTREKTDMQLYTRSGVTAVNKAADGSTITLTAAQPYVECASCHDPHTTNATFLRVQNTGSAVCLACHIK